MYFKSYKKLKTNKGLVALITVLIISAVALSIGVSISLLSIGQAKMSLQQTQSSQSAFLANLCAEEALMKLKEDSNYLGNEIINSGNSSCQILPLEGNWLIKVLADYSNQVRKVRIVVNQIDPEIIITSWQEVADF